YVSNLGRICSVRAGAPRILKPNVTKTGAHKVSLMTCEGKHTTRDLGVLVLEHFDSPMPRRCLPAHRDGDRSNFAASNLEWRVNGHFAEHLTEEKVAEMLRRHNGGRGLGVNAIAREYKISQPTASRICARV